MCEIGMRNSIVPEGNDELTFSHNEKIATFINDPGLDSLSFKSKKTEAEPVQQWVFNDVLPA